jgi:hypothetical protein
MKEESPVGFRQIVVDVEKESMECVFENGPDDITGKEACHCGYEG